ncbi:hypothetical protein E5Q_05160 [Mixia osmundae IAM 14324]|uniref:Uncharacterized protein n=1 Tax=Mixia osmundae (strain CBS 9802 / IAM 14324 / JCM 22182 / KY 12970) TaxID=764103 RepID=G7E6L4_MIXOS|nr:hypothetical protein E5Q_05160 [Mixia osmundae IAM 14324]
MPMLLPSGWLLIANFILIVFAQSGGDEWRLYPVYSGICQLQRNIHLVFDSGWQKPVDERREHLDLMIVHEEAGYSINFLNTQGVHASCSRPQVTQNPKHTVVTIWADVYARPLNSAQHALCCVLRMTSIFQVYLDTRTVVPIPDVAPTGRLVCTPDFHRPGCNRESLWPPTPDISPDDMCLWTEHGELSWADFPFDRQMRKGSWFGLISLIAVARSAVISDYVPAYITHDWILTATYRASVAITPGFALQFQSVKLDRMRTERVELVVQETTLSDPTVRVQWSIATVTGWGASARFTKVSELPNTKEMVSKARIIAYARPINSNDYAACCALVITSYPTLALNKRIYNPPFVPRATARLQCTPDFYRPGCNRANLFPPPPDFGREEDVRWTQPFLWQGTSIDFSVS